MNLAPKILRKLRSSVLYALSPETRYGCHSFAQYGEDIIVSSIFALRGISTPSYIDVGAHHPFYLSNTALLSQRGSRGINVEPNPEHLASFVRHRPKDTNLNIGIGSKRSTETYYCFEDSTLNTFSAHDAATFEAQGHKSMSKLKLDILPILEIVMRHSKGLFPDFLSIDVEGMEIAILSSIEFDHCYPKVICVETATYSGTGDGEKRRDVMQLLEDNDYILYADTNLNSIYVKRQFWLPAKTTST
jgi:FkbM family methyltransferase